MSDIVSKLNCLDKGEYSHSSYNYFEKHFNGLNGGIRLLNDQSSIASGKAHG